jgi:hypothetical protein
MGIPRAPAGAGREGGQLWRAVLGEFELNAAEMAVLRQAVRVADRCEALAAKVAEDGLTTMAAHGAVKVNPVAAELRLCELSLARLLVAMRIPVGGVEEDQAAGAVGSRSQHRGLRGVYQLPGGSVA